MGRVRTRWKNCCPREPHAVESTDFVASEPPYKLVLLRAVDECSTRLDLASPSAAVRELSTRAERLRAAVRASTDGNGAKALATGELVLELAEDVLGKIDPSVESLRRALGGAHPERASTPNFDTNGPKVCPSCRTLQRGTVRHCRKCAADLLGVAPSVVIDRRYALMEELGRGAMGVVYMAHDIGLNRSVALKILSGDEADDDAELFQREATAVASIRSDHVVQVYAFGTHDGAHFLAMEHVEGSSLEAILAEHARTNDRIPVARAVTILAQVARGLTAVHAAGVVHRDVKPANIVVEERSGRPVLIDFGLALRHAETPAEYAAAGTPHYMAPEQITASTPGDLARLAAPTDVYALGCVAFELLCGRPPFEAPTVVRILQQHIVASPTPPSKIRPGLAAFDPVIERALAKDPAQRHASCSDFATALEDAFRTFASPGPTLPPPPSLDGVPSRSERGPLRVLIVDDDEIILKMCALCASKAFGPDAVEIVTASSGPDALAAAEVQMPDILLLDYAMPKLDGLETLSRLRAMPRGTRARVIVISASANELPRWKFTVLGVNDFVAKPVRIAPFVELLKDIASDAGFTRPGAAE